MFYIYYLTLGCIFGGPQVSGTAMTTGRSLSDLGVDHEELDRLTHTITKAFDFMVDHLGNSKLNDPVGQ